MRLDFQKSVFVSLPAGGVAITKQVSASAFGNQFQFSSILFDAMIANQIRKRKGKCEQPPEKRDSPPKQFIPALQEADIAHMNGPHDQ